MQLNTLWLCKKNTDFREIKNIYLLLGQISLAFYIFSNLSVHIPSVFILEYFFVLAFFTSALLSPWQLKNDISVKLIGLSLAIPLLSFGVNYLSSPSLAEKYFLLENLLRLMVFSAVGFWIGGKLKNIYLFLLLVLCSSMFAIFNVDVIQNFTNIFNGKRVDSGIGNSQYTASLFGLATIGMVCFFKEFIAHIKPKKTFLFYLVTYLIFLALCVTVLLGSQTRAAIIAMDLIYLFSIMQFLYLIKHKKIPNTAKKLFIIYALSSLTILSISTYKIIEQRSGNKIDTAVIGQVVNKDFENISMSSLGIRINSWLEVSKWVKEKPIHGWGAKANSYVFQQSNFPENIKKFGHFHNSYIEFTLAYGFVGLALIIYTFYWINRQAYLLARDNKEYIGIWLFTLYGTLFTSFINLFESYLFYSIGIYTTAILLAPTYSLYLSTLYKKVKH